MTASSADAGRRRRLATGPAALALLMAAAPALAQQSQQGPVRLFPAPDAAPQQQPAQPAQPAPLQPQAPQQQPQSPSSPSAIPPAGGLGGVAVAPLDRLDPAATGLLEERTGGLPYRLWQGTPAELAVTLVDKLPPGAPSPVAHELAYRLLASTAANPQGPEAAALLPLRVEHLRVMGEAPAAARLAETVPAQDRPEALRRALVDALLAQATAEAVPAEVCPQAREGVAAFDSPYWQKVAAFCDLLDRKPDSAQLTLAMLRETGHDDAPFYWAADQLSGLKPAALKSMPAPNPLLLAMVRAAGRELPADALGADAEPWLLAAVAGHGPLADRLALAERAAAMGALTAPELARLYAAEAFSEADLAAPAGTQAQSPRERARLFQRQVRQNDPAVMAAALEGVRFTPLYPATAALYADGLAALPPLPELTAIAARALFAAGRADAARPWLQEARLRQDAPPAAAAALRALWPYERVADAPAAAPFSPEMLTAWRATQPPGTQKVEIDRRHTLVLGLLQALGEPVASADWLVPLTDATVDARPVPDAAILRALDVAAAQGRIGETVALALIALGNEGPAVVHPEALFRAVAALRRIGLEADAKALALEAMAAAGV
ncbi:hypothetical protein [Caenispirillum bisanense]|uniref:hypothetical protein n=1 Tax=Caenispirillum bisanense TaxID=414052 RepID=UPI0031DDD574